MINWIKSIFGNLYYIILKKLKLNKVKIFWDTDGYKLSHARMYPEGTTNVFTYFESRLGCKFPSTVMFGIKYLLDDLEQMCKYSDLEVYQFCKSMSRYGMPVDPKVWINLKRKYKGKLPVIIKCVPEGSVVDAHNVMLTIENIDPDYHWLTGYLETYLSRLWYPCTVATTSYNIKKVIRRYHLKTGASEYLDNQLHDFGSRGTSCQQQAQVGGAAHLLNFRGSDTVACLEFIEKYYKARKGEKYYANTIPATEHSVMTALKREGEPLQIKRILQLFWDKMCAMVIDSFNDKNFILVHARALKDVIMKRTHKLIFRPDSGEPATTSLEVVQNLDNVFGSTENAKGFKVLDKHVGALWGDGIDINGVDRILKILMDHKYASDNIAFGMGGGLLQKCNRDIQRFKFGCSAQQQNGEWVEIFKDPISGTKTSMKGRVKSVVDKKGRFFSCLENESVAGCVDAMITVYNPKDGVCIPDESFWDVINRVTKAFNNGK